MQGIAQIERFFRAAAEVEVDKDDIRRYFDFIEQKASDLLLNGATHGEGESPRQS